MAIMQRQIDTLRDLVRSQQQALMSKDEQVRWVLEDKLIRPRLLTLPIGRDKPRVSENQQGQVFHPAALNDQPHFDGTKDAELLSAETAEVKAIAEDLEASRAIRRGTVPEVPQPLPEEWAEEWAKEHRA